MKKITIFGTHFITTSWDDGLLFSESEQKTFHMNLVYFCGKNFLELPGFYKFNQLTNGALAGLLRLTIEIVLTFKKLQPASREKMFFSIWKYLEITG